MLFLCRDKERFISVEPPATIVHHTDRGIIEEHISGQSIRFTPLAEGDKVFPNALPVKFGITHPGGHFRSEDGTNRKGLTQAEAEEWLAKHKDYGYEFVAVGDKGEILGPGEWGTPVKRSEAYVVPSGKDLYCHLCERELSRKGSAQHMKSKKHLALLVKAEEEGMPAVIPEDE